MDVRSKARSLRKNSTDVERLVWRHIRNKQIAGFKFRRQVPIGNYIVDFLCTSVKLVIEIDGGQHADAVEYDQQRTLNLERQGYKVVRYWNNDVLTNISDVLETLTLALYPSRGY